MTDWGVIAFAILGIVAWLIAAAHYRAAQDLLVEVRREKAELADTLKREECASDWRHMATRGGWN